MSPVREREFEPDVWVASLFEVRSIVINGLAYPDIPGRSLRSGSWLSARTCGLLPSLLWWTTGFEVACPGPRPAGHLGYRVASPTAIRHGGPACRCQITPYRHAPPSTNSFAVAIDAKERAHAIIF